MALQVGLLAKQSNDTDLASFQQQDKKPCASLIALSKHIQHDLSAVATTTRPGLALCLQVGLDYTKQLVGETGLLFIPVHHMEAHALTARMVDNSLSFPFLVLLVSGGHCILALARNVGDFVILGETLDGAPGEAFDKIARRLKLQEHPQCKGMSGGQAIETLAKEGNIHLLDGKHLFRMQRKDCNFSFIGFKQAVFRLIQEEEKLQGTSNILENVCDICASVQHHITRHLVVSGGVASNGYIRHALSRLCDHTSYKLVCPPPKLCTDNGIMVAWAGMEHLKLGTGLADNPQEVRFEPR
ncbi:putative tRNA N6-adenosine threonylcarbamoyltransferase, mitochondrial-like [Apostichopus japonicus]|uniref:N(6)-L-threonylcarbamoyladenine synthase n=1 Tax=Stichopus japonicus TaxID=307972 RepID=A0A2G8JZX6_STIJA|nr:putative tRNA N6-adenosine threonylcarbamoyltransferase, mitochondrial-like [Apostichopus japonicus]